jgi:hypothetical protein
LSTESAFGYRGRTGTIVSFRFPEIDHLIGRSDFPNREYLQRETTPESATKSGIAIHPAGLSPSNAGSVSAVPVLDPDTDREVPPERGGTVQTDACRRNVPVACGRQRQNRPTQRVRPGIDGAIERRFAQLERRTERS